MPLPQRTCLGCYKIRLKSDLIRFVRLSDGTIIADKKYKEKGRGAYVCPNTVCIDRAMQTEKLKKAFRISPETEKSINQEAVEIAKQSLLALI